MKVLASDLCWGVCLVLLGMANLFLFLNMMFMMGFWSMQSLGILFHLYFAAFIFSYYWCAPLAVFGFLCSIGCSMAKQTQRAALLAALSGGALFNAIIVWTMIHVF